MLPFRNGCKTQDFSVLQEKNAPGLIQKHLSHGTDRCYHSDIKRPPQGTQLLCRARRGALGDRGSLRALSVARAQPFPKAWLPVLAAEPHSTHQILFISLKMSVDSTDTNWPGPSLPGSLPNPTHTPPSISYSSLHRGPHLHYADTLFSCSTAKSLSTTAKLEQYN